ncbi:MAG: hypothetical protein Q8R57_10980 [Bacteroidota bacterium]|nr:hypothetical protein [Bacteroidota bacterium]
MKRKILLGILALTLIISACKKDLNLDKFNEMSFTPEFGLPLATINMKMSDILKDSDEYIHYDPDGFIRFIIREDSIASFPVDSVVQIPTVDPLSIDNKLGVLEIQDLTMNQGKTLGDMTENFGANTKAALNAVTGQVAIFPAISDANSNVTAIPLSSNEFDYVSLSRGTLVLTFTNEMPVTIDEIRINIYNTTPFQFLLGQLTFRNIAPMNSKVDSINLTGATLSSGLGYSLPTFKTFTSSSPVFIDTEDEIKFKIETKGLKAYEGAARFPSQTINPQELELDLKGDDPSIRLRKITFSKGKINYNLSSNIAEKLQIKVDILGAMKNGVAMAPIIIEVNNNTKVGHVDLTNVEFDLSQDPTQAYNKIKVNIEPRIISSGQIRTFDSSNFVKATFGFNELGFKEINGFLGTREIVIEPTESTFDLFDQFSNGFPLDDPKIKLITSNSIGVPVSVTLDAEGISSKGVSQKLNAPAFTIGYPTVAQKGQVINDTKVIDKNNSSIVQMLNVAPKTIKFGGKATINAAGFTGYNDFIVQGAGISVGYEVEMPLSLKTNSLVIENTAQNALFTIENGQIKDFAFPVDSNGIEYVDLIMRIDNGIPFNAELDLFFADKDTVIMDTVSAGVFMRSSIPDANGRTIKNTIVNSTIRLSADKLKSIKNKNLINMVVRLKIATYGSGANPVKIYADYLAKIGISVKVKLKFDIKKNPK